MSLHVAPLCPAACSAVLQTSTCQAGQPSRPTGLFPGACSFNSRWSLLLFWLPSPLTGWFSASHRVIDWLNSDQEMKEPQNSDQFKAISRDFPSGPVGKTSLPNAVDEGSIPDHKAKIPHASWPKKQNINNRGNIVTTSIKTLKMVHIKHL